MFPSLMWLYACDNMYHQFICVSIMLTSPIRYNGAPVVISASQHSQLVVSQLDAVGGIDRRCSETIC